MDIAFKIVGCIICIMMLAVICVLFAGYVFCIDLERIIITALLLLVLAVAVFMTLMLIDILF